MTNLLKDKELNRYWGNENQVYLVMWKSNAKTGATLCEIRKTEYGLDKLLRTLAFLGIKRENTQVIKVPKCEFSEEQLAEVNE